MDFERLAFRASAILFSAAAVGAATIVLGAAGAHHHTMQVLAPERIRDLLPSSLGPLARGDISAERVTALGVQISQAEAQYRDNNGHYITLRIEDMGGRSGLKSLVPWASGGTVKQTSTGDTKNSVSRGHEVHEQWDPPATPSASGYGEYAMIVGQRYLVEASGKVAAIGALKNALRRIDLAKLKSLKSGGLRGN